MSTTDWMISKHLNHRLASLPIDSNVLYYHVICMLLEQRPGREGWRGVGKGGREGWCSYPYCCPLAVHMNGRRLSCMKIMEYCQVSWMNISGCNTHEVYLGWLFLFGFVVMTLCQYHIRIYIYYLFLFITIKGCIVVYCMDLLLLCNITVIHCYSNSFEEHLL